MTVHMRFVPILGAAFAVLSVGCTEEPTGSARRPLSGPHLSIVVDKVTIADLGTLGGRVSYGRGLNDVGQVVGTSNTASGETHAFLWTAAGGMVELGGLGGDEVAALDINNLGLIAGIERKHIW